jgi:hypothetical protein
MILFHNFLQETGENFYGCLGLCHRIPTVYSFITEEERQRFQHDLYQTIFLTDHIPVNLMNNKKGGWGVAVCLSVSLVFAGFLSARSPFTSGEILQLAR